MTKDRCLDPSMKNLYVAFAWLVLTLFLIFFCRSGEKGCSDVSEALFGEVGLRENRQFREYDVRNWKR